MQAIREQEPRVTMGRANASWREVDVTDGYFPVVHREVRQIELYWCARRCGSILCPGVTRRSDHPGQHGESRHDVSTSHWTPRREYKSGAAHSRRLTDRLTRYTLTESKE